MLLHPDQEAELKEMVKEFQCPGCTNGCDIDCGKFELEQQEGQWCKGHSAGTFVSNVGRIALGLPKGFNRYGPEAQDKEGRMQIRLHASNQVQFWNEFNVPVWAMEYEGHLLVRTYQPRLNRTYVDILKGKTLDFIPKRFNVFDVSRMIDDID